MSKISNKKDEGFVLFIVLIFIVIITAFIGNDINHAFLKSNERIIENTQLSELQLGSTLFQYISSPEFVKASLAPEISNCFAARNCTRVSGGYEFSLKAPTSFRYKSAKNKNGLPMNCLDESTRDHPTCFLSGNRIGYDKKENVGILSKEFPYEVKTFYNPVCADSPCRDVRALEIGFQITEHFETPNGPKIRKFPPRPRFVQFAISTLQDSFSCTNPNSAILSYDTYGNPLCQCLPPQIDVRRTNFYNVTCGPAGSSNLGQIIDSNSIFDRSNWMIQNLGSATISEGNLSEHEGSHSSTTMVLAYLPINRLLNPNPSYAASCNAKGVMNKVNIRCSGFFETSKNSREYSLFLTPAVTPYESSIFMQYGQRAHWRNSNAEYHTSMICGKIVTDTLTFTHPLPTTKPAIRKIDNCTRKYCNSEFIQYSGKLAAKNLCRWTKKNPRNKGFGGKIDGVLAVPADPCIEVREMSACYQARPPDMICHLEIACDA